MSIRRWPEMERPREKLLTKGAPALSDAELLAIFLRTGCKGLSAVDLARQLLNQFGSLSAILQAPESQFCQHLGLGKAKYAQLQASFEMIKRSLSERLQTNSAFTEPEHVRHYLITELQNEGREVFAVLLLDSQHQLIHYQPLFWGTLNAAHIYPREVVKLALKHNAAATIFAHNHPSGTLEPSKADLHITAQLLKALQLVDIRVLDHFIIGKNQAYSFAEHGHL